MGFNRKGTLVFPPTISNGIKQQENARRVMRGPVIGNPPVENAMPGEVGRWVCCKAVVFVDEIVNYRAEQVNPNFALARLPILRQDLYGIGTCDPQNFSAESVGKW